MKPKFSIITCTWNSAATLAKTLESISEQTNGNYEHIFVDGGSTDETLQIIRQYGRAKQIIHGVRGGISHAMNVGARAAEGEFISHLHSDDYLSNKEVLQSVENLLDQSGAGWLVGRTDSLRDGNIVPPLPQRSYTPSRYRSRAFFIAHPAVYLKKDLFVKAGGFNENLKYAMDIDLWLRLIAIEDPFCCEEALAVFREHPGSISTAQRRKARREELVVRLRDKNATNMEKLKSFLRMARHELF